MTWNDFCENVKDHRKWKHVIKRSTAVRAAAGLGVTGVCTAVAAQYTTHPVLGQLVIAGGGIFATIITKMLDEDLMAEIDPPPAATPSPVQGSN